MSEELSYEEALERIQMLKSANGDLVKALSAKDKEIAALKEHYVSEGAPPCVGGCDLGWVRTADTIARVCWDSPV